MFFSFAPQIVESCRVSLKKPQPAIYELCLQQLKVSPEECLYLDDIGKFLKAGEKLGLNTIKVGA